MSDGAQDNESLKAEYLDVSANMRAYGGMRFAQLTLYVAITAGLLKLLLTENPQITDTIKSVIAFGGFITTIAFGIMEERAADFWHDFKNRAIKLERKLKFKQYRIVRVRKVISATNAVRLLFISMLVLWSYVILTITGIV